MKAPVKNPSLPLDAVEFQHPPRIFISEPGWRWTSVIPDYFNLWYVLRGSGSMEVDGVRHRLSAGMALILAPGQQVDAVQDAADPIHNYAAHFYPLYKGRRLSAVSAFPTASVVVHEPILFEAMARQTVRLAESGDALGEALALALVFALTIQILRSMELPSSDPVDRRLLDIMDGISASPGRRVSVESMAREAGLSRVHFTRRFRKVTGETPSHYLIRHRVERAGYLIRESRLKMTAIAELLGYSDVYFFSRQFKQVTGMSPGQWRRVS